MNVTDSRTGDGEKTLERNRAVLKHVLETCLTPRQRAQHGVLDEVLDALDICHPDQLSRPRGAHYALQAECMRLGERSTEYTVLWCHVTAARALRSDWYRLRDAAREAVRGDVALRMWKMRPEKDDVYEASAAGERFDLLFPPDPVDPADLPEVV